MKITRTILSAIVNVYHERTERVRENHTLSGCYGAMALRLLQETRREWWNVFIFTTRPLAHPVTVHIKALSLFCCGSLTQITSDSGIQSVFPTLFRAHPHHSPRGKTDRTTPAHKVQMKWRRKDGSPGAFIFIYRSRFFTQRTEQRQNQPFKGNGAKRDHLFKSTQLYSLH